MLPFVTFNTFNVSSYKLLLRILLFSRILFFTIVMQQWVGEFHAWWPPLRVTILHDSGSFNGSRASLIQVTSQIDDLSITNNNL